jgi:hypothetical protein
MANEDRDTIEAVIAGIALTKMGFKVTKMHKGQTRDSV